MGATVHSPRDPENMTEAAHRAMAKAADTAGQEAGQLTAEALRVSYERTLGVSPSPRADASQKPSPRADVSQTSSPRACDYQAPPSPRPHEDVN